MNEANESCVRRVKPGGIHTLKAGGGLRKAESPDIPARDLKEDEHGDVVPENFQAFRRRRELIHTDHVGQVCTGRMVATIARKGTSFNEVSEVNATRSFQ